MLKVFRPKGGDTLVSLWGFYLNVVSYWSHLINYVVDTYMIYDTEWVINDLSIINTSV